MSQEPNPEKSTAIRALGETDRSPEHKQARDSFVEFVIRELSYMFKPVES